jgi:hypothetical protein
LDCHGMALRRIFSSRFLLFWKTMQTLKPKANGNV